MAYAPRPDGLNDVILDDGTRVPSGLPAAQLEAMGHSPIAPMGAPPLGPAAFAGPGASDLSAINNAIQQQSAPQSLPPVGPPPPPQTLNAPGSIIPQGATLGAIPDTPGVRSLPPFDAFRAQAEKSVPSSTVPNAQRDLVPLGAGGQGGGLQPSYMPQGRTVKLKGGDIRASFARQPGIEVGQDVKNDLTNNDPENLDINATQDYDDREQARLDRAKLLQDQQQQVDHAAARRAQVDQMIAQKQQVIADRDRELDRLTPQSAREVFEDRSGFAKALSAISIALGGYLQGRNGGENMGLKMLNDSIHDEVAAQRARYDEAAGKGREARNDYAQALQIYGTPEAAALDLEMRHNAAAEAVVRNQAQQIENRDSQQAAFQMADQLRAQRAQTKLQLDELEKGKVLQENWVNVPDRYVQMGGPPHLKSDQRERLVRMPGGGYAFARSAEDARKVQGSLTGAGDVLQGLQKLRSLADDNTLTDMQKRAQYKAISTDLAPIISVQKGQGAMSDDEVKRMTALLGDPDAVIQDRGATLDEAIRAQQGRIGSQVRDYLHRDPDANYPVTAGRPNVRSDQ